MTKDQQRLADFQREMKRRGKARSTIRDYLGIAERFADFCAETKPESPEQAISDFLGHLTPCAVATQKQALSALAGRNGFYACLGRDIGPLSEDPKLRLL